MYFFFVCDCRYRDSTEISEHQPYNGPYNRVDMDEDEDSQTVRRLSFGASQFNTTDYTKSTYWPEHRYWNYNDNDNDNDNDSISISIIDDSEPFIFFA